MQLIGQDHPVAELIAVTDPEWRAAVDEALAREGELLAHLAYTHRGGRKDWFAIQSQDDLERVLAKVGYRSPSGPSDMISLLQTPEFLHRGTDVQHLRRVAKEIARRSWVIVAEQIAGDPQLHDDFPSEDPAELDEWFDAPRAGLIVVGEDPYLQDRTPWPAGDEFVAYAVRADGTVKPGAY